jgi:hypothetical protein
MSQQAADARRQLSSIDYRHFQNIDDYLSSCERVRVLIPTLESFCKWSDAELERLRIKHSDNPHLLELADFYVSLNWLILPISVLNAGIRKQPFGRFLIAGIRLQ